MSVPCDQCHYMMASREESSRKTVELSETVRTGNLGNEKIWPQRGRGCIHDVILFPRHYRNGTTIETERRPVVAKG